MPADRWTAWCIPAVSRTGRRRWQACLSSLCRAWQTWSSSVRTQWVHCTDSCGNTRSASASAGQRYLCTAQENCSWSAETARKAAAGCRQSLSGALWHSDRADTQNGRHLSRGEGIQSVIHLAVWNRSHPRGCSVWYRSWWHSSSLWPAVWSRANCASGAGSFPAVHCTRCGRWSRCGSWRSRGFGWSSWHRYNRCLRCRSQNRFRWSALSWWTRSALREPGRFCGFWAVCLFSLRLSFIHQSFFVFLFFS